MRGVIICHFTLLLYYSYLQHHVSPPTGGAAHRCAELSRSDKLQ
jgi:hypothetical protein